MARDSAVKAYGLELGMLERRKLRVGAWAWVWRRCGCWEGFSGDEAKATGRSAMKRRGGQHRKKEFRVRLRIMIGLYIGIDNGMG